MRRWLMYAISAVSTVLAVATAVFWVRSYVWNDWIRYVARTGNTIHLNVETQPGAISIAMNLLVMPNALAAGVDHNVSSYTDWPPGLQPKTWPLFGGDFGYQSFSKGTGSPTCILTCPLWPIELLSVCGALPVLFSSVCWAHRKRHGLCLRCGYDLRASPERCPECGTVRRSSPTSTAGGAPEGR